MQTFVDARNETLITQPSELTPSQLDAYQSAVVTLIKFRECSRCRRPFQLSESLGDWTNCDAVGRVTRDHVDYHSERVQDFDCMEFEGAVLRCLLSTGFLSSTRESDPSLEMHAGTDGPCRIRRVFVG
jgi:hypothetical protein